MIVERSKNKEEKTETNKEDKIKPEKINHSDFFNFIEKKNEDLRFENISDLDILHQNYTHQSNDQQISPNIESNLTSNIHILHESPIPQFSFPPLHHSPINSCSPSPIRKMSFEFYELDADKLLDSTSINYKYYFNSQYPSR